MIEIKKWWRDDNKYTKLKLNIDELNSNFYEHSSSSSSVSLLSSSSSLSSSILNITNNDKNSDVFDVTKLPQIISYVFNKNLTKTTNNIESLHHEYHEFDFSWLHPSNLVILLIIVYGIVVFGGIIGNISLIITLYSTSSIRLRNPLLVALCLADFLVASVSAPTTIITLALTQKSWTLPLIGCKIIYFMQSMPVAASTLSFFMLSLDRYATVKHPKLAQLRQRRHVHSILAILSWIGANAICIPILLAYNITNIDEIFDKTTTTTTTTTTTSTSTTIQSNHNNNNNNNLNKINYSVCRPDFGSIELKTTFIFIHTAIVFVMPGLGVILNHYGVRKKLCALSLTARAAHGELPLPMPILHRPTHMIIVTGIANANRVVQNTDSSDEHAAEMENNNLMMDTIANPSNSRSPRVMREIRVQQQRQKYEQKQQTLPAPGLPLSQTSTLRARRRLANMLIAAAVIFIACWTPHVFCVLWSEFGNKQYCSITISHFSLLLGYAHSVISPIIYWILNHNSLRQSPCAPFIRTNTVQRFLRTHWRSPTAPPPPPSSTNEAALGAFNPRYIKNTPKQYRAQASSHYLY